MVENAKGESGSVQLARRLGSTLPSILVTTFIATGIPGAIFTRVDVVFIGKPE